MHRRFEVQRRILFQAYQRYLACERALDEAQSIALSWFPEAHVRGLEQIGNPGSRIRQLYERRDRAVARLRLARQALEEAQRGVRARGRQHLFLIELREHPGV
jgi:hypothetical protein